ncbi:MAG: hypothetical protein RR047_03490, partial [Bacilli bacterium]
DIGDKLKIPCSMCALCRIKQGNISLDECIELNQVSKDTQLITIDSVLRGYPSYIVNRVEEGHIYDGVPLNNLGYTTKVKIYTTEGKLIALYKVNEVNDKQLVMDRLFVRREEL